MGMGTGTVNANRIASVRRPTAFVRRCHTRASSEKFAAAAPRPISVLHLPEGGSKNFERSEEFSGRGDVGNAPRPEILFSLSLNFEPPTGRVETADRTLIRQSASAAALRSERRLSGDEFFPAIDFIESAVAEDAVADRCDEHQAGVMSRVAIARDGGHEESLDELE